MKPPIQARRNSGPAATVRQFGNGSSDRGKLVFFVGAGFTKAIADAAPTGNDFLVKAFRPSWAFSNEQRVHDLKNFLIAVYHPLQDQASYPRVEDVLSLLDYCISTARPLNKEFDLERLVRLRGTLVYVISQMIKESFRRRGGQELARQFVQKALELRHEFVVISTNYDIVLDNSLLSEARSCNYGIRVRKSITLPAAANQRAISPDIGHDDWHYQDEFTDKSADGTLNRGPVLHLKLHGSLNWVHCPKCDEVDITLAQKGAANLLQDEQRSICVNPYCTCSYEAFLVGPTMLKTYTSRILAELWKQSEQAVADAEQLIFIGYSMPDADYLIRALLIRGLARNPRREQTQIIVVDKKPEPTSEAEEQYLKELTNRYRALFGNGVDVRDIGLDGFLETLVTTPIATEGRS